MTQLERYDFKADESGPHIVFLGNVHGNEPCGRAALERLRDSLHGGDIALKRGRVTILPCCNPQARQNNTRFVDINLNRIMGRDLADSQKHTYESPLAHQIMDAVDEADILVDLHSFTQTMPPCTMCVDESARDLAHMVGIERIVCDSPFISRPGTQTTMHYARATCKKAVLVECGSHNDPAAVEVACDVVLRVLQGMGMTESRPHQTADESHEYIVIRSAIYRAEDQKLVFPLDDANFIKEGDPLFHCIKTDRIFQANDSGRLFMKNANTPVGEEYAYICDFYNDWPQRA